MLVPELKSPVANARSFAGNHSAVALIAAGKLPASPIPSAKRAAMNPATDGSVDETEHGEQRRRRRTVRRRFGVRHRRDAPHRHRDRESNARADAVDEAAREQQADRVGELEAEDDVGVVNLAPAEFLLQRRLEQADHLAIDVVDRRRQEQQQADHPPIPSRSAFVCHLRSFMWPRLWDCGDGWRTRDGRAVPRPSACPSRPRESRRAGGRRRASIDSEWSRMPLTSRSVLSAIVCCGARVAGDLDDRRDRDSPSACRVRS